MRVFEVCRHLYEIGEKKGILDNPEALAYIKDWEAFERIFIPEDYKNPEVDKFMKSYNIGLEKNPRVGSFLVRVDIMANIFSDTILVSKNKLEGDNIEVYGSQIDRKIGDHDNTGVLFFKTELYTDAFINELKLTFHSDDKDRVKVKILDNTK